MYVLRNIKSVRCKLTGILLQQRKIQNLHLEFVLSPPHLSSWLSYDVNVRLYIFAQRGFVEMVSRNLGHLLERLAVEAKKFNHHLRYCALSFELFNI